MRKRKLKHLKKKKKHLLKELKNKAYIYIRKWNIYRNNLFETHPQSLF